MQGQKQGRYSCVVILMKWPRTEKTLKVLLYGVPILGLPISVATSEDRLRRSNFKGSADKFVLPSMQQRTQHVDSAQLNLSKDSSRAGDKLSKPRATAALSQGSTSKWWNTLVMAIKKSCVDQTIWLWFGHRGPRGRRRWVASSGCVDHHVKVADPELGQVY